MSSDAVKLAPDARARVDTYLDAIEKVLERAGRPRDERRGVADDVEAQILEMLADRAGFAPTVADVEAVLADLDPPEAYAETEGAPAEGARPEGGGARPARPAVPKGPRLSRAAIVGACWAPAALLLILPMVVFVLPAISHAEPWGISPVGVLALAPLALIGLSAPFGTTILGLVAISHIRHSAGRLYGMGLAVFDALLFPLLLLDGLLVFVVMAWANLGMPEGLILVLIADVAVVVLVWRRVQPRAEGQGGPESPQATRSRRRLGVLSLVLAVAGVVVGTGAAAIGHVAGLPSAWMAGYLAFLGLEVAALVCGIVAWSATPVAKVGTIVSGVLMAGSVLMLG